MNKRVESNSMSDGNSSMKSKGMSRREFLKTSTLLGAGLTVGQLLASCSSTTEAIKATQSQSTESPTTGNKVQIKFWKYQDENEQKTLEALVDKYNQQSSTTEVLFEVVPWEQYLGEKVPAALAAHSGPDVFWLSAGEFMKYVTNELIIPIDDAFGADLQADFLPQSLKAVTVGGKIYGVPHEMGVQSLIYDQELFESMNLKPPESWDEMIEIASAIKTDTRWGIILPTAPDVFQNFIWYPWLWMAGGEVVNEEWAQARINEEAGVKALGLWADLVKKGLASPKGGAPFDADVAQGKAAMAMLGHWVVDNFKQNYPNFQIGIAKLPPMEKGGKSIAAYGGWFSVVNAATPHPKEAKEFAVWLFGKDPQNAVELMMPPGTYLSPRKSVMEEVQQNEYYKQEPHPTFIKEIWPKTRPEPAYPPDIVKAVTDSIQAAMFGGVEAQKAADDAAQTINTYLSGPDGERIRSLLK